MIKIREAIVVEGKYDKNTLSQIVDAPIFVTDGFGIFKDKQQLAILRKVAQLRGLVVFTDPDGAGFVIRNYLKGAIEPQYLKHAYIPDIMGKERRKATPGKEGKLGVEGMRPEVIVEALRRAGVSFGDQVEEKPETKITKQDLVELGLSGGKGSAAKRDQLLKKLDYPQRLSPNGMLLALNLMYSLEELTDIVRSLESNDD